MGQGKYFAVVAATAVLLAGCGGDDSNDDQANVPGATVTVPESGATGVTGASGEDSDGASKDGDGKASKPKKDQQDEQDSEGGGGGRGPAANGEGTGGAEPGQPPAAQKKGKKGNGGQAPIGSPPVINSPPAGKPPRRGNPTTQERIFYEHAKVICGTGTAKELAQAFGIKASDPKEIAATYAQEYEPKYRKAVRDGCYDGFKK